MSDTGAGEVGEGWSKAGEQAQHSWLEGSTSILRIMGG